MKTTCRLRIMTPAIAHAIAWDAGNESMRKAGRSKWSKADWNAACRAYEKALPFQK